METEIVLKSENNAMRLEIKSQFSNMQARTESCNIFIRQRLHKHVNYKIQKT